MRDAALCNYVTTTACCVDSSASASVAKGVSAHAEGSNVYAIKANDCITGWASPIAAISEVDTLSSRIDKIEALLGNMSGTELAKACGEWSPWRASRKEFKTLFREREIL